MIKITLPTKVMAIGFEYGKALPPVKSDVATLGRFERPTLVRTTICKLYDVDPTDPLRPLLRARGVAKCSLMDNFKKENGRKIALARAMEDMEMSKEDRAKLWEGYFDRPRAAKKAA